MRIFSINWFYVVLLLGNTLTAVTHAHYYHFKPLEQSDLTLVYQWFQDPAVSQWWPVPAEQEDFFKDFLKRIRSLDTHPYLIFMDKAPIGYIQYYSIDRNNPKQNWLPTSLPEHTVGIDQFIGETEYRGKGHGPVLIQSFIQYLKQQLPQLEAVIVDPDPENTIAIRCYEKAGFIKLGTHQAPGGPALLMRSDLKIIT